jgi:hypothetical protein
VIALVQVSVINWRVLENYTRLLRPVMIFKSIVKSLSILIGHLPLFESRAAYAEHSLMSVLVRL